MESPLENQNKNETEMDLKHEVHNVKAVKKANKPKFSVKRLLITLFLILFTAAASGGSVWYVLDQKLQTEKQASQIKIEELEGKLAETSDTGINIYDMLDFDTENKQENDSSKTLEGQNIGKICQQYSNDIFGLSFTCPEGFILEEDIIRDYQAETEHLTVVLKKESEGEIFIFHINNPGYGPFFPHFKYTLEKYVKGDENKGLKIVMNEYQKDNEEYNGGASSKNIEIMASFDGFKKGKLFFYFIYPRTYTNGEKDLNGIIESLSIKDE